jgi:hypothetical protein
MVMGLLPMDWPGVDPEAVQAVNQQYAEVAWRRGAAYVNCGNHLDPTSTRQFVDGLHPQPHTQLVVLRCLRAALHPYLPSKEAAAPSAEPAPAL